MSTFWKKVLISLFGLVIISIFVCRVFEETVQEGMPDVVPNIVDAGLNRTEAGIDLAFDIAATGQRATIAGAATGQRATIAGQQAARDIAIAGQESGERAGYAAAAAANRQGNFVAGETGDAIQFGADTAQKGSYFALGQMWDTLRTLKWFFIMTTILGVLILIGKYVGLVIVWFFSAIKCGFIYLSKFNSCFFWYLLDIISWIIYLFYCFPFWLLDQLFSRNIGDDPNLIQNIFVNPLMDLLDDIDCAFYEIFGFYIIHFKENVKDRCFDCKMPDFPPPPDLTNREGIKKAYNEYGAGLIGGIFRA